MEPTLHNRFLGVASFSFGSSTSSSDANRDELNEDDVLWTSDFTTEQSSIQSSSSTNDDIKDSQNYNHRHHSRASLHRNSGILEALLEPNRQSVLCRKPLLPAHSWSKSIPWTPKPPQREGEFTTQSMPTARKMNQSAAMNVPLLSIEMAKQKNSKFIEDEDDGDRDGDDEMLPPHEIVAGGSRRSPKTAFSVLEGVGRTLKGRDLRQVRNAVWRQTGFLD